MYKPSNFPEGTFGAMMAAPQHDALEMSKNCDNQLYKKYAEYYQQITQTGILHEVPLPFGIDEPMTSEHLGLVAGKLIGGLIREGHREQFYENDPMAGSADFNEQTDKRYHSHKKTTQF